MAHPDQGRELERIRAVFAEIDRMIGEEFLSEGRPEQPSMPETPALESNFTEGHGKN